MGRDRNDQGRYADRIDPEAVLDVFDAREDPARPLTANDITEEVGIARRTAHNKLNALVERGALETRKVGARGRVWWTPIPAERVGFDVEELEGDAETTLDDPDGESAERPGSTNAPTDTPPEEREATAGDSRPHSGSVHSEDTVDADPIGDGLDGWEPDTEANPRTARAQTRRAAEWLRERGEYRRAGEFQDALADDSSLSSRVWWERHARPGLNHLADHGLVEYVKNRGYRWTGPEVGGDA